MAKKYLLAIMLLHIFATNTWSLTNEKITSTILKLDSALFEQGFNNCDVHQFEKLLSDDFAFYHDIDGKSDKQKFITDFKNGICNQNDQRNVKRTLVPNKTELFPLYKNGLLYAVLQNGEHLFSEKREVQGGKAKFSNLWQIENGLWKLKTSYSFNHQAQKTNPSQTSFLDNETETLKWLNDLKIPTLGLGLIENGKLQQVKVYGKLNDGQSAPYNTIFNAASLTKPITAMVALKLISPNKWSLNEPIYKYWKDIDVANHPYLKKLNTRLILSHQSGFPNWRWMNTNKKLNFEFEPGKKYQYSGEGYEYLRHALEHKFKKSLQQLALENIFAPLNMTDSKYIWTKSLDTTRLALNFSADGKAYPIVKNVNANAADDLYTTVEDYGKFLVYVLKAITIQNSIFQ